MKYCMVNERMYALWITKHNAKKLLPFLIKKPDADIIELAAENNLLSIEEIKNYQIQK